ncbi:MAG: hypothetical protein IPJ75_15675 [Ignavibacteriales bacterium]|nr:hypothetical protein [Ignavibacteriales bacterium]
MKDSFGIARFLMKNFDDLDNPVSYRSSEFYVNPGIRMIKSIVIENESTMHCC